MDESGRNLHLLDSDAKVTKEETKSNHGHNLNNIQHPTTVIGFHRYKKKHFAALSVSLLMALLLLILALSLGLLYQPTKFRLSGFSETNSTTRSTSTSPSSSALYQDGINGKPARTVPTSSLGLNRHTMETTTFSDICYHVTIPVCLNLTYDHTHMSSDNQNTIFTETFHWDDIIMELKQCYEHAQLVICGYLLPKCVDRHEQHICRGLCTDLKEGCYDYFDNHMQEDFAINCGHLMKKRRRGKSNCLEIDDLRP